MTYQIRIQQVQLYDIPMNRRALPAFMRQSFNMLKDQSQYLETHGLTPEIFHNQEDTYTRFQFGIRHGFLNITAYGDETIKAMEVYLELLSKQKNYKIDRQVTLTENYQLHFLPRLQTYMLKDFLINPKTNDKLLDAGSKEEQRKILSQYLFNNFIRIFDLVGYRHNTDLKKIDPKIVSFKRYKDYEKTFARAKALARYDIRFKTDLYLPHFAALGGATAMGYGKLYWE